MTDTGMTVPGSSFVNSVVPRSDVWSIWSTPVQVGADKVELFAQATGDRQSIHMDDEAAKEGPFKVRIAHGLLTLGSMTPWILEHVGRRVILIGFTCRFQNPVPVGSSICVRVRELSARQNESRRFPGGQDQPAIYAFQIATSDTGLRVVRGEVELKLLD